MSVHPSPVNTGMMRSVEEGLNPGKSEDAKTAITEQISIGRFGGAVEIAKLVLFLTPDESELISGS
ncbi:SDR family oxidoreductase [Alkalibacterium sp. 20]|uniref:SDR family oxidoreductase n=1 Tax=Alkalibacterium sp. 20 TaxID=1798803 RepID=UPI0008FFF679|nr:SDR family oxidoreductase [Alkalibacterium sp. 20]OJF94618.1 hypothetical protein AX762_01765 [Alkalibacterium sp. 20]